MGYTYHTTQQLHCDVDTAWKFFSSANNLSRITPKEMNFTVLTDLKDEDVYPGMIIDYTVSPLLGIPLKWRTVISQVNPKTSFTDFQEKGPFKLWKHFHEFIPNEKGVLMRDTVDYELPLGFLGSIAHSLVVKNKVKGIFDYRFEILESMFNK